MKCAYVLASDGNDEESYEILKSAAEANVFYHDKEKLMRLKLHTIGKASM